jgi:hypothetical protein
VSLAGCHKHSSHEGTEQRRFKAWLARNGVVLHTPASDTLALLVLVRRSLNQILTRPKPKIVPLTQLSRDFFELLCKDVFLLLFGGINDASFRKSARGRLIAKPSV